MADQIQQQLDELYRQDKNRVLATLIRLFNGNFDLAEESLQDAFAAALAQWSRDGIPENPVAWLISTGRFKAIDRLRQRARFDTSLTELATQLEIDAQAQENSADEDIEDDRLRLVFTCCHPALSEEARTALTLREVCGLTTEEIAAAFLVPPATLAQRIVRAKAKIRDAGIPYEVPGPAEFPQRLDSVLQVIYLVFNEGYSASSGERLTRIDLSAEAIRLGRLLLSLLPDAEVAGLLALMLLHDARRTARSTVDGDLIPLEQQNRQHWNQSQIDEGRRLVLQALGTRRFGVYSLQAAIAAVHAEAPSAADTDWTEIAGLYDALLRINPSPVVELNRAVALAMRDGPETGLALIDDLLARGELTDYHLIHAARADLYRRLHQFGRAKQAYQQALTLARQEPERRFLQARITDIEKNLV